MNNVQKIIETIEYDRDDSYNIGFEDGFNMAILMEGDEKFVVNLCKEVFKKCRTEEAVVAYAKARYKNLMVARKTGISMLFDEVLEEKED